MSAAGMIAVSASKEQAQVALMIFSFYRDHLEMRILIDTYTPLGLYTLLCVTTCVLKNMYDNKFFVHFYKKFGD